MTYPRTRLLLLRHAEATYAGPDCGLTERGQRQAAALVDVLLSGFDQVVTSPARRCRETLAAISQDHSTDARLAEFDFGPSAPDAPTLMSGEHLAFWKPEHGLPDGETLAAFQARVQEALEELCGEAARILVVTHSGVIDAALRWAYGLGPADPWITEADVWPASITEFEHWPIGKHARGAPRHSVIYRIGDQSHLPAELRTSSSG